MWIIIAAIIIFIIFADSDTKPSANKKRKHQHRFSFTLHRQPNRILQLNLKSDGTDCIPYCQTLSLDETSGISYGKKNQCFHLLCLFPD
ncbi:MAG: hypothetical protein ACLTDC_10305 [Lachnospiraceae bacterium]